MISSVQTTGYKRNMKSSAWNWTNLSWLRLCLETNTNRIWGIEINYWPDSKDLTRKRGRKKNSSGEMSTTNKWSKDTNPRQTWLHKIRLMSINNSLIEAVLAIKSRCFFRWCIRKRGTEVVTDCSRLAAARLNNSSILTEILAAHSNN